MRKFLLSNMDKAENTVNLIANTFAQFLKNIIGPVLIVIGAAAALYAIYLGVMYAKAEDANKRKEVQGRLIGAAIGVVIILVGIVLVYAINWENLVDQWNPNTGNNEWTPPANSVIKMIFGR